MNLERRFSEKESLAILRLAIDRKYSNANLHNVSQEGMGLVELSDIAKDIGVSSNNLDFAIQEYESKKSKKSARNSVLGRLALVTTVAGGAIFGIKAGLERGIFDENVEYVEATVLIKDDKADESYLGSIRFSTNSGDNYTAKIYKPIFEAVQGEATMQALREGSELTIRKEILERRFAEIYPKNFAGSISYDHFKIKKE